MHIKFADNSIAHCLCNELGWDYVSKALKYKDDYNFSEKDYFIELIDFLAMFAHKLELGEGKEYLESIDEETMRLLICFMARNYIDKDTTEDCRYREECVCANEGKLPCKFTERLAYTFSPSIRGTLSGVATPSNLKVS